MKLIQRYEYGKPVYVQRYWGDHWPGCDKCREVVLESPATFAKSCAEGAALIMEELAKRQAPIVAQEAAEVKEWARKAGVFKIR